MEKEFLPYEIALELKELGFSERCLKSYYKGSSLLEGHGNVYDTPAPTFSQCFRWFREKYGYLSYIDMDNYSFYRFTIYKGKGISEAPYHTYEEAELSCLKKIIEIIKSKSE